MWRFLESVGSLFVLLSPVFIFAGFMSAFEFGAFTPVVCMALGLAVVIFVIGFICLFAASKLHDKWLKETYPHQWEANQNI